MTIPFSSTLRQELPPDVIELLRRLAVRGWMGTNEAYITEAARELCATYGIRTDLPVSSTDYSAYTGYLQIDGNTAALVEWLDANTGLVITGPKASKVLVALLGNLSEERAQYHFDLLIKAKRDENAWARLISRTDRDRAAEHYMTTSEAMRRQPRPETPKTKAVRWLKEQLQCAKDDTYALARQAVAEGMGLGTPGDQG